MNPVSCSEPVEEREAGVRDAPPATSSAIIHLGASTNSNGTLMIIRNASNSESAFRARWAQGADRVGSGFVGSAGSVGRADESRGSALARCAGPARARRSWPQN